MLSIHQCCFQLYPNKKFPLFLHWPFERVLAHNSLYLDHFKCMLLLMMTVTLTQMMKTFPPSSHSWTRLLKQVRTESQKLRQGVSKVKDTALGMKWLSFSWKCVDYVDDGDNDGDDDWGPACVDLLALDVWNRWKTLLASISRNNSWIVASSLLRIHVYFAVKKVTPS